MDTKLDTLSVIREITSDGGVTDEEVINLAMFLNDNLEARETWPGIAVYEVLRDVLDDGQIDDFEREALLHVLEGIEILSSGQAAADSAEETQFTTKTEADEAPAVEYELTALTLPPLEVETVREKLDEPLAVMRLVHHECRCDNWKQVREGFPSASPARACACIVGDLFELGKSDPKTAMQWPRTLLSILRKAKATGRGLEPVGEWKSLTIGRADFVISKGKTDWCNIYIPDSNGSVERFSYHLGYQRWGHGVSPSTAKTLETVFRSGFKEKFESAN